MNTARSSQTLDLNWAAIRRLQEQAEHDQLRWFSAESPAYFAALLAFAAGSSCWRENAAAIAIFAGVFASVGFWRIVLAGSMQPKVDVGALRRSVGLTGLLWAALGCWTALSHLPLAAHFIYLLLTAGLAAAAARGLASDLGFAYRYLLILLAPAVVTQASAACFGGFAEGYALAAAALLFLLFMAARAAQFSDAYWEERAAHERLETEVRELKKAGIAAETSRQIDDSLLAKISEDTQGPLRGVARMTALLLETPTTGEQREYLEIIRDSTAMLRHAMNNLLDFALIETGELKLASQPFDARLVLDGVAVMFASKAAAKSLELRVNPGLGLNRALVGDPQRIGQALANLVANAVKFTEQGHIEISAACRAGIEKAELLFEVRDTGIGIPPDKLARLFAPSSDPGLGLPIAEALAAQMGGRISAESNAAQGSLFRLTLLLPYASGVALEEASLEQEAVLA